MAAPASDSTKVSVSVPTDPATAFDIFTTETDLWWRKGPKFRVAGRRTGVLLFEPGMGGRLLEQFETYSGTHVHVTGTITVWDPPQRLQFEWRGANFAANEKTEVEVTFEARGATTLVTVHHRGWAALRADHPARHGLDGPAFTGVRGLWWGELMTSLREWVDQKT